uniref:Replication factor A C-terminal domain-containing protein n=1 Tax=Solanum lycopersicum TaxID=4081 RepID=A0A3Q7EWT9_SOLLC
MTERLNINEIDENIEEWICKVQVVDKGHPRTTREGNKKYQLMILQDEEETQIQVIMHGTDIAHYANEFVPFQTYLLSGAFVSESIKACGISLHQFSWTIDKGIVFEPIDKVIPPEPPLLPPTLLKITSFDSFDYQVIGFEFDILALVINGSPPSYASNLALVINGSPPSYASNGNRIQEFIINNYECQFEVTIKDDTGSTTAMISDKIGEELLSLTVAEIHDICCIKKQLLSLVSMQHILLGKTFTVQIKKLFAKNKDASSAKLFSMSITEKDIASNLPLPINTPTTPESSKRKMKQIMIKED